MYSGEFNIRSWAIQHMSNRTQTGNVLTRLVLGLDTAAMAVADAFHVIESDGEGGRDSVICPVISYFGLEKAIANNRRGN